MKQSVKDFIENPHPLLFYSDLPDEISEHEGFEPKPYHDTRGYLTIGKGTLIEHGIDESLADVMMLFALDRKLKQLEKRSPIPLTELPLEVAEVLGNMAYQLGVDGLMKFKNMWAALAKKDYHLAANEMLNSAWAQQTPRRAHEQAEIVRSFAK